MYRDSLLIGTGVLCRSLYTLELSALPFVFPTLTVNTDSSSKSLRLNEKSSTLWHKRLGRISRHRIKRLIKDEILPDLDTCVDCIKGKLIAKVRNVKIDRCTKFLEVIHTDICGSFTPRTMGGYRYFITFIDDYSHYGFFKLIREKFESSKALKAVKAKVEL